MALATLPISEDFKISSMEVLEEKIHQLKVKISSKKGPAQVGVEQNDEKIELLLSKICLKKLKNKGGDIPQDITDKYVKANKKVKRLKNFMEQARKAGKLRFFDYIRRRLLNAQNELIMYLFDEGLEDEFKEQRTKDAIIYHHPFDLKPHTVFSISPVFSHFRIHALFNEDFMKFSAVPEGIRANDENMADFINKYLSLKASPVKNCKVGELMVKYGNKYGVDPLVLLAISAYETGYGKLNEGFIKIIGLDFKDAGAGDKDEGKIIERQLEIGALNFRNMKLKAGVLKSEPLEHQLFKINRAGWSKNPDWHKGVLNHYGRIVAEANRKEFKLD